MTTHALPTHCKDLVGDGPEDEEQGNEDGDEEERVAEGKGKSGGLVALR